MLIVGFLKAVIEGLFLEILELMFITIPIKLFQFVIFLLKTIFINLVTGIKKLFLWFFIKIKSRKSKSRQEKVVKENPNLSVQEIADKAYQYYDDGNFELAFDCAFVAVNKGHVYSSVLLGRMFFEGKGAKQDYAAAKDLFMLAVSDEVPEAYFCLGNMYELGQGVEQNDMIAFDYYEHASELGDMYADFNLGLIYQHGKEYVRIILKLSYVII